MNDSGFDLLIYIALTIGASALSLLKSSKDKKAKAMRQEMEMPGEEEDLYEPEPEPVVVMQQQEEVIPGEIFMPVENNDEISETMKKKREEGIAGFGRTDEERYAMLEKRQQEGRASHKKYAMSLKDLEALETSNEQLNNEHDIQFEFDLRNAIISSEILNRKYQ